MVELGTRVEGSRGRRGEGRDGKVELPNTGGVEKWAEKKKVVKRGWHKGLTLWTKSNLFPLPLFLYQVEGEGEGEGLGISGGEGLKGTTNGTKPVELSLLFLLYFCLSKLRGEGLGF